MDTTTGYNLRYSRHLALPDFGAAGQEKLAHARVVIIGLGGLGSAAAIYLAVSGAGTLVLNDFDRVDVTNLQRQILYADADIGAEKTQAAARSLKLRNPECRLELIDSRMDQNQLLETVRSSDVVLDGSDNFGTRYAVNRACMQANRPLISGAAIRFTGQITVFDIRDPTSPCYACLYPESNEALENCASNGILAPVAGFIGCFMAVEAIKLITGIGRPLTGRLLRLDARNGETSVSRLTRDPACPACGKRP
ncbi:MAG: molybdopterin-synthase adenylyltransferase MoeB [Gammaproteobacteria bacterium]|nr:molybdopterin-synthase adenylyltransferase MoeB [Gammaproteobacteria bacterium]